MNRTQIEWALNPDGTQGYTWNVITGCLNGCDYCYARRLANTRLRTLYLANGHYAPMTVADIDNPFYPRFWEDRLPDPLRTKGGSPKGIFTCDMSDLFGRGIPERWTRRVLGTIRLCPQHRFYLLTKQPQNLIKFSPFPQNAWVGQTLTAGDDYVELYLKMEHFKDVEAKVKFISFEPLLGRVDLPNIPMLLKAFYLYGVNWVIIGGQTKPTVMPKIEWVREIVEACDKAGVKVFLKNNLEPLWTSGNRREPFFKFSRPSPGATEMGYLRQEMPEEVMK